MTISMNRKGPGHIASALFICALALGAATAPAVAQVPQVAGQPPASSVPVPGELELAKLIWSTLAAVDHANQAGNYSVLRDLSAPGFQINNDSARLAQIFSSLRSSGIDLSNTLLLAPTYSGPATIVSPGVFRVRGFFGLRPTAIGFDLYYQWIGGKWRLFGVSITPATMINTQLAPLTPQPQPGLAPRRPR